MWIAPVPVNTRYAQTSVSRHAFCGVRACRKTSRHPSRASTNCSTQLLHATRQHHNSCALACRRCPSASRGDHAGTAVGLSSGTSNATNPITQLIARRYRARRRSRANTSTTECMLERPVWINRACTQTGSPIRIGATNRTPLPCAVTQSPAPPHDAGVVGLINPLRRHAAVHPATKFTAVGWARKRKAT